MMKETTSITIDKETKGNYEYVRRRINKFFQEEFGVNNAYSIKTLLPKLIEFAREDLDAFAEFCQSGKGWHQ